MESVQSFDVVQPPSSVYSGVDSVVSWDGEVMVIMRMLCSAELSLKSPVCSLSAGGGDEWVQIHQPPFVALNQL